MTTIKLTNVLAYAKLIEKYTKAIMLMKEAGRASQDETFITFGTAISFLLQGYSENFDYVKEVDFPMRKRQIFTVKRARPILTLVVNHQVTPH